MTTPTGILFADPRVKPLSMSGSFQPGCYVLFFTTGTTALAPVFADGFLTTQLSQTAGAQQPSCTADSAGRFNPIYLNPATIYRVQMFNAAGALLSDTDPYVAGAVLTALSIGLVLYPQSAQEQSSGVIPANYQYPPGDVRRYGATGNGTNDDSAAFASAMLASSSVFVAPTQNFYRLSNGITVPGGVSLYGSAFQPGNNPTGTILTFDLSVGICVTLGGPTATNGSCSIKSLTINRATGTPPAGSIGLLNQNTYATTIEDVQLVSHQIPLAFLGTPNSGFGSICMVNRVWTGAAYDTHCQIDSFNEIRFNQCRFGMDGPGDQSASTYCRIQGGSTTNPAGGPNTIVWNNCQFNQGANTLLYAIAWQNMTTGNMGDCQLWQMNDCYIEDVSLGIFYADTTWNTAPIFGNFIISNSFFNVSATTIPLLAFTNAVPLNEFSLSNCQCTGSLSISSTVQINGFQVDNCYFLGNVTVSPPNSNSSIALSNNQYQGGLTLSGACAGVSINGGIVSGPGVVRSGITSGNPVVFGLSPYNRLTQWTPNLQFGGANVGITYSTQQGSYQIVGDVVLCEFYIALSAVGTSTGAASISNLPIPDDTSLENGAGSGITSTVTSMTSLTSMPTIEVLSGAALFNQFSSSTTGAVSNANFSSASIIRGSFSYKKVTTA